MTARKLVHVSLLLATSSCQVFDPDGLSRLDAGSRDGNRAGDAALMTADDAAPAGGDAAPATTDAGGAPDDAPAPGEDAPPPADDSLTIGPGPARDAPVADAAAPPRDTPPACTPVAETCDRKDNDCDGVVDEGFGSLVVSSSYTALATFHAGCTALTRFGPACNAAAHRFCMARGCYNTGFAPVENSADVAAVGCVSNATTRTVAIATLTTFHPDCQVATRHSLACNAAIHRHCRAQGFVTGFGPVEGTADIAVIACLGADRATVVPTTYTALAAHHPACNATGGDTRFGPPCNAAISRFCAARGDRTGFGPVENSGDVATVVCVKP